MYLNNTFRFVLLFILLVSAFDIPAQTNKAATTHCQLNEVVRFSCQIDRKTVSLCTGSTHGKITSLAYRYGTISKIENQFVARPNNSHRFYATEAPANPDELIKQVWFDRNGIRYLMTECLGGGCAQSGRLAVLRGREVLMNKPCTRSDGEKFDSFSKDFLSFNSATENGWSATELMIIGLDDNSLEKLFPPPLGKTW